MIKKHNIITLDILRPLHGEDYKQRFEDQKSTMDTVFDQLLPVFNSCGVISVKIVQDIMEIAMDGKKPNPKTIKKQWKEYLSRNRVDFKETTRDRIDIVMQGHKLATQQGHVFRLTSTPLAKSFGWDQVSTSIPSDTKKEDLLIQI